MTLQQEETQEPKRTPSIERSKESTAGDDAYLPNVNNNNSIDIGANFHSGESEEGSSLSTSRRTLDCLASRENADVAMATASERPPKAALENVGPTKNQTRNGSLQYYSLDCIQHKPDRGEPLEDFEVFRQELEKITGCCRASRMRQTRQWNINQVPAGSTVAVSRVPFDPNLRPTESGGGCVKARRRSRSADSYKEFRRILGLGQTVDRGCGELCVNCGGEAHPGRVRSRREVRTKKSETEDRRRRVVPSRDSVDGATSDDSREVQRYMSEANRKGNDALPSSSSPSSSSSSVAPSSHREPDPYLSCATVAQLLGEFYTEDCNLFDDVKINSASTGHPTATTHDQRDHSRRSPALNRVASVEAEGNRDVNDGVGGHPLGSHPRIVALRQRLGETLTRQKNEIMKILTRQEVEWMQLEVKFGVEKIREFRRKMALERMNR